MLDFYAVLQVDPLADPEVIRAAYRVLARKYHPDHGGDPSRMIELNNAWDVLGDPARRAAYDTSRAVPANRQPAEPIARPQPGASRTPDTSQAGPPPGRPSGTVLDFGRYAGWSLGEIARQDTDYLEWLQRATFGRRLRSEIAALLAERRGPGATGRAPSGGAWKGRL